MGPLKPTERQLAVLTRLRGNPDFIEFQLILEDYEKEVTEQCITAREPMTIAQAQGGVVTLRALRELIRLAPQMLEKVSSNKRNTP